MLLITLCSLIAVFILAFAGLRLIAPAIIRTRHKIKAPGIDRMEMVEIGGIKQALYIRGQNADNPIILWVHGGPGNSMMPLLHLYQYAWENDFTVVNWDQRNVGKTYFANDPAAVLQTMRAERVLEDVHEVTAYLQQQFNKKKIILAGHSWGRCWEPWLCRPIRRITARISGFRRWLRWRTMSVWAMKRRWKWRKRQETKKISRRWKLLHHIRHRITVQTIWQI